MARIAGESLDGEHGFWEQFHNHGFADSYTRRNRIVNSTVILEAGPGGFQELAAYMIIIAVSGGHVHVSCDSGAELSIADSDRPVEKKPTPKFDSFLYDAKALQVSGAGRLRARARCSVKYYGQELGPEQVWIDASGAGLVSLAEQCFDLGEATTPPRVELRYDPRRQLTRDSLPTVFRRV